MVTHIGWGISFTGTAMEVTVGLRQGVVANYRVYQEVLQTTTGIKDVSLLLIQTTGLTVSWSISRTAEPYGETR